MESWSPGLFHREQPVAHRMLRRILDRDGMSSAYLLSGPRGTGRLAAALWFAAGLLCDRGAGSTAPFGVCGGCRVEAVRHPDVHLVERGAKRNSIGIEDVRLRVREPLSRRAYLGGRKVVIVPEAHLLTPQAQNALLKTLEDPVGDSTVLLIAPGTGYLLPTVRSRCVVIPFTNPGVEAFQRALLEDEGLAGDLEDLYALSAGDVAMARDIAGGDLVGLWESLGILVESLRQGALSPAEMSRWADRLSSEPERTEMVLNAVALMVRRPMRRGDLPVGAYAKVVDILVRTGELLRANANRRLAWEVCLVKLQGVLS